MPGLWAVGPDICVAHLLCTRFLPAFSLLETLGIVYGGAESSKLTFAEWLYWFGKWIPDGWLADDTSVSSHQQRRSIRHVFAGMQERNAESHLLTTVDLNAVKAPAGRVLWRQTAGWTLELRQRIKTHVSVTLQAKTPTFPVFRFGAVDRTEEGNQRTSGKLWGA